MESFNVTTIVVNARKLSGLTQAQLAVRSGTSQSAIARYETGAARPSTDTLTRILKAGGLELEVRLVKTSTSNLGSARARKIRENRGEIIRLMRKAGAKEVRIFGSVARGDDNVSSDIDFLVDFDTSQGVVPIMRLKRELSKLLQENVDVAPVSLLKKSVLESALKEAVPL